MRGELIAICCLIGLAACNQRSASRSTDGLHIVYLSKAMSQVDELPRFIEPIIF